MSKSIHKVVLVRIDGLTATFDTIDHEQACREAQAMMLGLWGSRSPVVKMFVAHDGQLDEVDVDAVRTMKGGL